MTSRPRPRRLTLADLTLLVAAVAVAPVMLRSLHWALHEPGTAVG